MLIWLFISAAGGVLGGMTRAVLGMTKVLVAQQARRRRSTPWLSGVYFSVSLLIAGLVGLLVGIVAQGNLLVAYLAGYVGVDFLDGLYYVKEKAVQRR